MLVLGRNQMTAINDPLSEIVIDVAGVRVVVTVLKCLGDGKVQLGFTGPREVVIRRGELVKKLEGK